MTDIYRVSEAVLICNIVDGLRDLGQYDIVNQMLCDIDIATSSTIQLVCWLRYTYCIRDNLAYWTTFRDNVKSHLDIVGVGIDSGATVEGVLRGLF